MTTAIPLDLWAYWLHRQLRAAQLEAIGHAPPPPLPPELTDPSSPPAAEDLVAHRDVLDYSGAAVADYLRDAGGRGRHLVSLYLGRGNAPDLVEPLVEPGPGLADLRTVVEHLATRKIGADPVPPPPYVEGFKVKASPIPCPACGARAWPATPSRPADQVQRDVGSILVDDDGLEHRHPVDR